MKLPYELNLLISGLKEFQYALEWQLFGNSYDDVRLELTWRKLDGLTKNFLSKGKDVEWKLKKHSVPLEAPADLVCGNGKTLAESGKKAGAENAKESGNEGHHTAVVKADKSVLMGVSVEEKKMAVADTPSDTASRRLRLQMSKASLDSNIVCEEPRGPALEKNLAREDSFIRKGGKKSPFRRLKKDEKLPTTGRLQLSLSVDHLDVIVPRESAGSAVHNVVQKILGGPKPDNKVARPKSQVNSNSDATIVPKLLRKDLSGASLLAEIPMSKTRNELRTRREEASAKSFGTKAKKTEARIKATFPAGADVVPPTNRACQTKEVHPKQESATDYKDAGSKILPSESPYLNSVAKDTGAREGELDCSLSADGGSTTNQDVLLSCAPSESSEIKMEQVVNALSTTNSENADHSPGILNNTLAEGTENRISPLQSFNGASSEEKENTNKPCHVVNGALAANVENAEKPIEDFSNVLVGASENANEPCAESNNPGVSVSSDFIEGESSVIMNGVHDQCDDSLAKRISQIVLSRKGSLGKGTLKIRSRTKDRARTTKTDEDGGKALRPRSKSLDPTKWSSNPEDAVSDDSRADFKLSHERDEKKEPRKRKGRQSWKYEEKKVKGKKESSHDEGNTCDETTGLGTIDRGHSCNEDVSKRNPLNPPTGEKGKIEPSEASHLNKRSNEEPVNKEGLIKCLLSESKGPLEKNSNSRNSKDIDCTEFVDVEKHEENRDWVDENRLIRISEVSETESASEETNVKKASVTRATKIVNETASQLGSNTSNESSAADFATPLLCETSDVRKASLCEAMCEATDAGVTESVGEATTLNEAIALSETNIACERETNVVDETITLLEVLGVCKSSAWCESNGAFERNGECEASNVVQSASEINEVSQADWVTKFIGPYYADEPLGIESNRVESDDKPRAIESDGLVSDDKSRSSEFSRLESDDKPHFIDSEKLESDVLPSGIECPRVELEDDPRERECNRVESDDKTLGFESNRVELNDKLRIIECNRVEPDDRPHGMECIRLESGDTPHSVLCHRVAWDTKPCGIESDGLGINDKSLEVECNRLDSDNTPSGINCNRLELKDDLRVREYKKVEPDDKPRVIECNRAEADDKPRGMEFIRLESSGTPHRVECNRVESDGDPRGDECQKVESGDKPLADEFNRIESDDKPCDIVCNGVEACDNTRAVDCAFIKAQDHRTPKSTLISIVSRPINANDDFDTLDLEKTDQRDEKKRISACDLNEAVDVSSSESFQDFQPSTRSSDFVVSVGKHQDLLPSGDGSSKSLDAVLCDADQPNFLLQGPGLTLDQSSAYVNGVVHDVLADSPCEQCNRNPDSSCEIHDGNCGHLPNVSEALMIRTNEAPYTPNTVLHRRPTGTNHHSLNGRPTAEYPRNEIQLRIKEEEEKQLLETQRIKFRRYVGEASVDVSEVPRAENENVSLSLLGRDCEKERALEPSVELLQMSAHGWAKCADCKFNGFCDDKDHKRQYLELIKLDASQVFRSQESCACHVCKGGAAHNGCAFREIRRLKNEDFKLFDRRNLCLCDVCVPFKYRQICLRQELRELKRNGTDLYSRLISDAEDVNDRQRKVRSSPRTVSKATDKTNLPAAVKISSFQLHISEQDKDDIRKCVDCRCNGFCDKPSHKTLYLRQLLQDQQRISSMTEVSCHCLECDHGSAHNGCLMREIRRLLYDFKLFDSRNLCFCNDCVPFRYRSCCLRKEMMVVYRTSGRNLYESLNP